MAEYEDFVALPYSDVDEWNAQYWWDSIDKSKFTGFICPTSKYGLIAQIVLDRYLTQHNIHHKCEFVVDRGDIDLEVCRVQFDIKCGVLGYDYDINDLPPSYSLQIHEGQENEDYYISCQIDLEEKIVYILGWTSGTNVRRKKSYCRGTEEYPCRHIPITQLNKPETLNLILKWTLRGSKFD